MKKVIKLKTPSGQTVKVMLDNWGSGLDGLHRRWSLQPEGWLCVDNGEIAQSQNSFMSHPMKLSRFAPHYWIGKAKGRYTTFKGLILYHRGRG